MGHDLTIASYNIHGCIGTDGVHAPRRIADVIRNLGADVVALQEVHSEPAAGGIDELQAIATECEMVATAGPTMERPHALYGNALLTREPPQHVRLWDLSVDGREPRGAIEAEVVIGDRLIRVVATHLGLQRRERRKQVQRLLRAIRADRGIPTIVLGDFNEWTPANQSTHRLDRHLGRGPSPATFPSRRPILALDRIWVRPAATIASVEPVIIPLTRVASDHLPVRARIQWEEPTSGDLPVA